ncbi:MAG: glycosyltransferase [Granulosicoccus sp.]
MRFSLIIPAWNEAAFIGCTLQHMSAVLAQVHENTKHLGELIVVDNNSTDNTAEIAGSFGVKVVFEPINQIARARNRGAAAAKGQALIFLDADTQCSYQLLVLVLARLGSSSVAGGGSSITPDRPVSRSAMRGISAWNWISSHANLAAGCFVYCRRDAFHAVGGFNERVYAGEELFLSRALKRWGKQNSMTFDIVSKYPVVTSARKLDWYSPSQLGGQMIIMLIPGAVYSKRFCKLWYDNRKRRNTSKRAGQIRY